MRKKQNELQEVKVPGCYTATDTLSTYHAHTCMHPRMHTGTHARVHAHLEFIGSPGWGLLGSSLEFQ